MGPSTPSACSERVPGDTRELERVTVLAVDDDPDVLELTARRLERADDRFEVETETDPTTALERVGPGRYDCVLSDYDMPRLDGLALLDALRERDPDLPFVLFTAGGSEAIAREAIDAGVTDFLRKGLAADQYAVLANRIAEAVSHYRTKREHRRTESLLADVADAIDEGVIVVDDGDVTWTNPAFERAFGAAAGAVVEDLGAILDRVPEGDRETVAALLDRVADDSAGEAIDAEHAAQFRYDRPSGERRWFDVTLVRAAGRGDRPGRLVGVVSDITDFEERLEHLRRSEAQFRSIAETSNDVIFQVDVSGELTYASPATQEMLGYDPGAYDTPDFLDFVTEADHELAVSTFDRVLDGESVDGLELQAERADGTTVTLDVNATPIRVDGEIVGVQGVARDVSDRKAREAELEQYQTVVETVPDGVFVLDADGDVVAGNESGAEILGYEKRDVIGRPFSSLIEDGVFGEESVDVYLEAVREMLSEANDRDRARYELEAHVDGERRIIEVHLALRPFEETFRGTIGVFRDVTERYEYERRLERQNERLDRFASLISHDLRNPLNVAIGKLELARSDCDSAHLDGVASAHDRMDRLVDDVLTLARRGEAIGDLDAVDLAALGRRAWASVESPTATLSVADDLGVVAADEGRARQLLENLFANAVEHGTSGTDGAEGGDAAGVSVELGALEDGDGFYVADDGPGVPPDEREAVFEYGHSTADSTGFGLAIVDEIAAAHGWSVTVTDAATGGARFEVRGVAAP